MRLEKGNKLKRFAQKLMRLVHLVFLSVLTALIFQSITAIILVNQQQEFLVYPNAKESDGWEWREWHIDIAGGKYFNIYFSSIRAVYIKYSIEKNYVSPNTMAEIKEWYIQQRECKEIKSSENEWKGYCSKNTLPPLKTLMVFPYQGIYISNYGFPNNSGASVRVTSDLSIGIQLLLYPTDFYSKENQGQ